MLRLKRLLYWLAPHGLVEIYRQRRYGRSQVPYQLPQARLAEVFPGIEQVEVSLSPAWFLREPTMVLPLAELLTVMAICRHLRPLRVFEIGTWTGETTLAMARACPPEACLSTLDIQSVPGGPVYAAEPEAARIETLVADSRSFDFAAYKGRCDLVLVDGDHRYPAASQDTRTAFSLLSPGGCILWDDYVYDPAVPECAGVKAALEELGNPRVRWLQGTRLAVYQEA